MSKEESYALPLGPQHPALVEPEYLKVHLDGETIVDVDIEIGFMHRGIEKALHQRTYMHDRFLIEKICGICSSIHTLSYCGAVEKLAGVNIPERAKYIRMIIAELERLHSHLLWVGIAGYEIGIDTVFQLAWRDREIVMNMLEKISGNRVSYSMNAIGGVRRDISKDMAKELHNAMDKIDTRIRHYINVFVNDSTITKRTRGTGILTRKDAKKYCAVGPTARGSDITCDIRKEDAYLRYDSVDFNQVTHNTFDNESRAVVRLKELLESTKIIRQCLHLMPKGDISVKVPDIIPEGEAIYHAEAPRGEIFYYAKSDGTDKPYRIKIKTPTLTNVLSLKPMLKGQQLADMPIIVASIDPCFACTDRVTLLDTRTGTTKTVDETYLRSLKR